MKKRYSEKQEIASEKTAKNPTQKMYRVLLKNRILLKKE
jgi:hypothetical protein